MGGLDRYLLVSIDVFLLSNWSRNKSLQHKSLTLFREVIFIMWIHETSAHHGREFSERILHVLNIYVDNILSELD